MAPGSKPPCPGSKYMTLPRSGNSFVPASTKLKVHILISKINYMN